jgi:molybdopterin-guanine dinucleotide biosynthesis protein A
MMTLGLVLAGGRSRRFGADKAEALFDGRSLLDHALAAVALHCDRIAVIGRSSDVVLSLADYPAPGLGPLGGIAAGLRYAGQQGWDQVLSVPVDCIRLPDDLRALLEPAPSYLESQPVIGLWPVWSLADIARMLEDGEKASVRAFARHIGARAVASGFVPPNVNTRDDLQALVAGSRQVL